MVRFLAVIVLGSLAIPSLALAQTKAAPSSAPPSAVAPSAAAPQSAANARSALPPAPPGKSTVIGGAIRQVDPVRDQLTLQVFGAKHPMKILYDERTRFFRNGVRTSLRDLGPENHASVETVLDGDTVFARSIHILSQAIEGECQGQVLSYNPATRLLTLSPILSREPIALRVPAGTSMVRTGQQAGTAASAASTAAASGPSDLVSDLIKGTLVSVKFQSANDGRGIATHIAILATPGSPFVFSGNITFLDLHAHTLALLDPRDGNTYKISFDPARFPISHDLHTGLHITVHTTFDGARYLANSFSLR